jgi:hypothetical protein
MKNAKNKLKISDDLYALRKDVSIGLFMFLTLRTAIDLWKLHILHSTSPVCRRMCEVINVVAVHKVGDIPNHFLSFDGS